MINFQQTANESVLSTATKILNESVTHSQNASRLGDLQIDSSSVLVEGKKLQTILYKETQFRVLSIHASQFPLKCLVQSTP